MSMSLHRWLAPVLMSAALTALTACGGVSDLTRQQVARSETAVKQAQTAIGNSEAGAVELQQAKDLYAQAQQELEKKNETRAQRLAVQAELQAQLATAKAQGRRRLGRHAARRTAMGDCPAHGTNTPATGIIPSAGASRARRRPALTTPPRCERGAITGPATSCRIRCLERRNA